MHTTLLYISPEPGEESYLLLSPSVFGLSIIEDALEVYVCLNEKVFSSIELKESIDPKLVAAFSIAREAYETMNEGYLDRDDFLKILDVLDSHISIRKYSLKEIIFYSSLAASLGARYRILIYRSPPHVNESYFTSILKTPQFSSRIESDRKRLIDNINRIISSSYRKDQFSRHFNLLSQSVQDYFEPSGLGVLAADIVTLAMKPRETVFTIHSPSSPEESYYIPYLMHQHRNSRRISIGFGIEKNLHPYLSASSLALFRSLSRGVYRFYRSLLFLDTPIGYSIERGKYTHSFDFSPTSRLSEEAKPGIIYGVLTDFFDEDPIETFLDQIDMQSVLPSSIIDSKFMSVLPLISGIGSYVAELSTLLSDKNIGSIGRILKRRYSEDKTFINNYVLGYLLNSRRFTGLGRYLGEAQIEKRLSSGEVKRAYFGKHVSDKENIGVSFTETEAIRAIRGYASSYISAYKKPRKIDVDQCIEVGRSAIYMKENGEYVGRCTNEILNVIDRDPFLLGCFKHSSMDVERRLTPTVTAFLLGLYALFKPRGYIRYEISSVGARETTAVKFYTLSFGAYSRSPAGTIALVIALILLALRIGAPKLYGDRPTVYLSFVSLALVFYIGALIGLFSRVYDYLYAFKYTSQYVMENSSKFMLYSIYVGEGGRAVILGLIFLIASFVLEFYHSRKFA